MLTKTKTKTKRFNKARNGSHHNHSRRYLKTYWPYIPMILIVLCGISVNKLLINSQVLGSSSDFSRSTLLQDTNYNRQSNHETSLRFSSDLNTAAQAKAEDMVKRNYWAHIAPDGKTPWNFISNSGYMYQAAGENLAYGFNSADNVVAAWMNSPGHRANILNTNYEEVGFGVATSDNFLNKGSKIIVVAEYGEPIIAVQSSNQQPVLSASSSIPVSRLAIWAGPQAGYTVLIMTALGGAAIATIIIRHALYFRRLLYQGESYVFAHPFIDIGLVLVVTLSFLFNHVTGFIN